MCAYVCSSTKPGATVGIGPSLLRHTAGQVEEEGASMEMLLLWRRAAATQSGERGVVVVYDLKYKGGRGVMWCGLYEGI